MIEIDFELTGTELVIRRGDLKRCITQIAQHREQDAARIAFAAHYICIAGLVGITHPVARTILLAQVELQLGTNDGGEVQFSELGNDLLGHPAWRLHRRLPAINGDVGEAPCDSWLPRHIHQRGEIRSSRKIGQTTFESALDRHHVAAWRRMENCAAEGDSVPHRIG